MADWTIETRPVFTLGITVQKGVPDPYTSAGPNVNQVTVQVLEGGQPWKTSGIQIQATLNTVHGCVNLGPQMTDSNGVAKFTYGPDSFPGFVFFTAAAQAQNGTEQQLVTADGVRIES